MNDICIAKYNVFVNDELFIPDIRLLFYIEQS